MTTDDRVTLATIFVLLVSMIWFDWVCLTDIARARYVRYLTRQQWALVCVISFPIGGMLWYRFGKAR
jgi:hypothetical protein